LISNPSPLRTIIISATKNATRFRKKLFCMDGTSPASLTQAPINANENADNIIKQIPLFLELIISNPFSLITKLQFQTNSISY